MFICCIDTQLHTRHTNINVYVSRHEAMDMHKHIQTYWLIFEQIHVNPAAAEATILSLCQSPRPYQACQFILGKFIQLVLIAWLYIVPCSSWKLITLTIWLYDLLWDLCQGSETQWAKFILSALNYNSWLILHIWMALNIEGKCVKSGFSTRCNSLQTVLINY